jgi:hypothetical protein
MTSLINFAQCLFKDKPTKAGKRKMGGWDENENRDLDIEY